MGSNEENYERLWAMRQENEQRLEELAAERRAREDDPLAEALRQPVEEPLAKWRREQEAAPPPRQRRLDTRPEPAVDWGAEIDRRVATAREFVLEVVGTAMGEERVQTDDWLRKLVDDLIRPLRVELAELKISNAELRAANVELRALLSSSGTVDLPPLPLRSSRAN